MTKFKGWLVKWWGRFLDWVADFWLGPDAEPDVVVKVKRPAPWPPPPPKPRAKKAVKKAIKKVAKKPSRSRGK